MALDSSNLGRVQRIRDIRDVWPTESGAFTPWLAENIDVLDDVLGMSLSVVTTEVQVGEFKLDIQAEDEDGRTVVIENQLEPTNHLHLGQSVVYAAGLNASVVVWISTRFREDHRSAMDWLNERTDSSIGFFGVEVSVVQIGDASTRAPVFTVVSRPNNWQKAVKSTSGDAESTNPLNAVRQEFINEVLTAVNAQRRGINIPARRLLNWSDFAFGPFGNWRLNFAFDELRTEVYLDLKKKAPTKRVFDDLAAERERWEERIGAGPLQWERLDTKRACRIAAVRTVNLDDEDDRAETKEWCERTLIAMYDVLDSHLRTAALSARTYLEEELPDAPGEEDWVGDTDPSPPIL
ncbi:DUF4268 domain-containing protein [Dietzia sp. 179-F 9C3 NHS]|uniref:DUF4268 domain-containing protein n=1 Tax=Dietzia sp. 179-F 9C3 NHS TaxID=3374295 RepID=UPI00387A494D